MSSEILKNLNPGVADLHPYEPGRSSDEVIAEFGLEDAVKLASNENPLGASPKAISVIEGLKSDLHLYPDGNGTKLKLEIASHEKVLPANIIIGNGSNEILELVARAFLNPNTTSVASKHAFAVYKIVTQSAGASLIEVPTYNWGHDLKSFHEYVDSSTRVIFISNPNNPTGTYIGHASLIEALNRIRQPFNVNALAQLMACEALNDHEHTKQSIDLNTQQYDFLFNKLTKLGLECIPSVGNFITFKGNFNGKEMFTNLMKKGVIVRPVDLYDMQDFIRVTIGTADENIKFISALEELL